MNDLLGDKARAKLARKQARHERSKAKLEQRRRRKAMKVAVCPRDMPTLLYCACSPGLHSPRIQSGHAGVYVRAKPNIRR